MQKTLPHEVLTGLFLPSRGLRAYVYRICKYNGLLLLFVTGEEDLSSETSPHDGYRFPTRGSRLGTRHVVQVTLRIFHCSEAR
jgi:hypothetical protein